MLHSPEKPRTQPNLNFPPSPAYNTRYSVKRRQAQFRTRKSKIGVAALLEIDQVRNILLSYFSIPQLWFRFRSVSREWKNIAEMATVERLRLFPLEILAEDFTLKFTCTGYSEGQFEFHGMKQRMRLKNGTNFKSGLPVELKVDCEFWYGERHTCDSDLKLYALPVLPLFYGENYAYIDEAYVEFDYVEAIVQKRVSKIASSNGKRRKPDTLVDEIAKLIPELGSTSAEDVPTLMCKKTNRAWLRLKSFKCSISFIVSRALVHYDPYSLEPWPCNILERTFLNGGLPSSDPVYFSDSEDTGTYSDIENVSPADFVHNITRTVKVTRFVRPEQPVACFAFDEEQLPYIVRLPLLRQLSVFDAKLAKIHREAKRFNVDTSELHIGNPVVREALFTGQDFILQL